MNVSAKDPARMDQGSAGIRFLTGCVLTTAVVTISALAAFWLGNSMKDLFPGNFIGFSLGVWLGTSVLFALNFFRPQLERAIVRDFEEMMLILSPRD